MRRASAEVIGGLGQVEHPGGVGDRAVEVAGEQRQRGSVHGDLRGEPGELVVVEDDGRRAPSGSSVASTSSSSGSTPVGSPVAIRAPTKPDGEHGPVAEDLVGQRFEPAPEGGLLAALAHRGRRQLDELRGPLEVLAGHGVGDRLGPVAVRLVPVARPPVELGDPVGVLVEQAGPEHVGEEVVVAVPGAAVVERDEEEVRPLEPLEHRPAARPAR